MRWVILEPVRQSGVSQKEKNKYCALTRIYGIQKDSTEEPICRAAAETRRREQTWMLRGKERLGRLARVAGKHGRHHV